MRGILFDKSKAIDKIDGMVAMAMSVGEEMSTEPTFDGNIRFV